MRKSDRVVNVFRTLKKSLQSIRSGTLTAIKKIEATARETGDSKVIQLSKRERKNFETKISAVKSLSESLQKEVARTIKENASSLKKEIQNLSRLKDAADSNSFLLEYKKKDLLLKAEELQNANEEISAKNDELVAQRLQIDSQAEELKAANEELQTRTESLLDQSDYLHEANETIANMVKKLELQNEEILRKNDELLNLNIEKNNLIGIVAHDLKSPLNQIKGLLTLVRLSGKVDDESAGYLAMMEQSTVRLNDLIAKILDVEAIESKQLNIKMEDVNLSALVHDVADRYVNDASRKHIAIKKEIEENTHAYCDKNYAEQVLENLVSNAIKFSPFEKEVTVRIFNRQGKAICEIRDQGPGLSHDDKKKLFGKYQKLSAKPTGNEISTGLGLSIVKKFVDAMNGEIWCESEPENGASFFVKFLTT